MTANKDTTGESIVALAERQLLSPRFMELFRDGMKLVEETASYLDGPGRKQSRKLPQLVAMDYATESMRLTTLLMQIASWLLLGHGVKEEKIALEMFKRERLKVRLRESASSQFREATLPKELVDLIHRAKKIYGELVLIDAQFDGETRASPPEGAGPRPSVLALQEMLRERFEK